MGLAIFYKQVWGRGWGRRMIVATTRYARVELGIESVIAGIESINIASQMAFMAAGFGHCESQDRLSVMVRWYSSDVALSRLI